MWNHHFLVVLFLMLWRTVTSQNGTADHKDLIKFAEDHFSEYVTAILKHYKQDNPVGVPVLPIPDPLEVPSLSHAFSLGRMRYENVQVRGISKFRIDHVRTDLVDMRTEAGLRLASLQITGNYSLSTWLSTTEGPFVVNLTDVLLKATGKLGIQEDGRLQVEDIDTDLSYGAIEIDFEGLGMVNSAGDFVFESVKPYMLQEVNANIKSQLNERVVRYFPQKFSNNVKPFDQVLLRIREQVGAFYDPLKVDDCNYTTGIFEIRLDHIYLSGLSTFHRDGNVTFEIRNDSLYLDAKMATKKLRGTTRWEVHLLGGSRMGTAAFTIDYLKVKIRMSQRLNTRHSPNLEDVDLEFGKFHIRFSGAGDSIDSGIEFAANIIPNLLRRQIAQVLVLLIKRNVGEALEEIRTDQVIETNLPKLDKLQKEYLKSLKT